MTIYYEGITVSFQPFTPFQYFLSMWDILTVAGDLKNITNYSNYNKVILSTPGTGYQPRHYELPQDQ